METTTRNLLVGRGRRRGFSRVIRRTFKRADVGVDFRFECVAAPRTFGDRPLRGRASRESVL
eukprot:9018304-Lingulodinium_polyedra.AAC.1